MLNTGYHLIARVEKDGVTKNVPIQKIRGELFNGEKRFLLKSENKSDSSYISDVEGLVLIDNVTSLYKSQDDFLSNLTTSSRVLSVYVGNDLGDKVKDVIWDSNELNSLTNYLIEKNKGNVHVATHSKKESFKGHELINRLVKLIVAKPEIAKKFLQDETLIENIIRCEELREKWVTCHEDDVDTVEKTKIAYARCDASYEEIRGLYANLASEDNNNLFYLIRIYNGKKFIYDFERNAFIEECEISTPKYHSCQEIDLFTLSHVGGKSPLDPRGQYKYVEATGKLIHDMNYKPDSKKIKYYVERNDGKRFEALFNESIPFDVRLIINRLDSYGYFKLTDQDGTKDAPSTNIFYALLKDWALNTPYERLVAAHTRSRVDGPDNLTFSTESIIDISNNRYYLSLREKIDDLIKYYQGRNKEEDKGYYMRYHASASHNSHARGGIGAIYPDQKRDQYEESMNSES